MSFKFYRERVKPVQSHIKLLILMLFLSPSLLVAQERREFIDPAVYFEMVKVEIVRIDEEGAGTLRVHQHDCGGCTEDYPFDGSALLETPFGNYEGLVNLTDWLDRDVLVVVGKVDGQVRRVMVI